MRGARRQRHAGFSLIELVGVLVIVGALAVFAAPRLNIGGFERYGFRQELLAGLRYAQKTAMASTCDVAVVLNASADEFALFYRNGGSPTTCGPAGNPFDDPVPDPSRGGAFARTAAGSVDLQPPAGTVVFDGFGAHTGGPTTIDIAGSPAITIDPLTGFVDG